MQLPDAQVGDRYRVTTTGGREFEVIVVGIGDPPQRVLVVDYSAIGTADDIGFPWSNFEWEKVQ